MKAPIISTDARVMWSSTPTPIRHGEVVVVDRATARSWAEYQSAQQMRGHVTRALEQATRIPTEAWAKVRHFLHDWNRLTDDNASNKQRRSFLMGWWNELLPSVPFPDESTVPFALIRCRLAYTAQYQGFEEAGCLDLLPDGVRKNYEAISQNRLDQMGSTERTLVALDVRYSLTMPRQSVDPVTGAPIRRDASRLPHKEKSAERVAAEAKLQQIAAGALEMTFEAGKSYAVFAIGSTAGVVRVTDHKGRSEEYDLSNAKAADVLYWRMYRWYRKEAAYAAQ